MHHRLLTLSATIVLVGVLGGCTGGSTRTTATIGGAKVTTPRQPASVGTVPGSTSPPTGAPAASASSATVGTPAPTTRVVPSTTRFTPATTQPAGCALGPQSLPSATITGTFITALAFAPDGRLFYTERAGRVMVFQDDHPKVFATVSTVTTQADGSNSERGLLGLAIDPNFAVNHYVYAFYSHTDYATQSVVRWTDCAGTGTNPATLVTVPSGSGCCHKGGRLAFGPDGKLYVTLGEEQDRPAAQDPFQGLGAVLRFNPDGTIPADDPFGPSEATWVFGLRNPFGIAFSPTGQLAISNNGPSGEIAGGPSTGYDTVIFAAPRAGRYQWPDCYGYAHLNPGYGACPVGSLPPDWSSETTTVVPTGATFVDAAGPAGYAGKLLVCSYDDGMLVFTPGQPHGAVTKGPSNCMLDVKEGPNHALYYSSGGAVYHLG